MAIEAEQSDYMAGEGDGPAGVTVEIGDDVPAEYRNAIEASVATLAKRSAEASKRAYERSKTQSQFLSALTRPLVRIIEDDDDASKELAAASRSQEDYRSAARPGEPAWPSGQAVDPWLRVAGAAPGSQVFTPPFHFQWQWHSGEPAEVSSVDRPNGRIELWGYADQTQNRVDAHAGFGVAMTTGTVRAVTGRSLRRTQHRYFVRAGSFSGSATVEGGMEMTALEDGRLLSAVQDKRFRRRVSNGEEDTLEFDGFATGDTVEVDFVMRPGRTYTFNVGGWVFCEAHGGVGTASIASATLYANVPALTAFFAD